MEDIGYNRIIHCQKEFDYWIEFREIYVVKKYFRDSFPIFMKYIQDDKDIIFYTNIIYYIFECETEELMGYLEEKGFKHICYSKDDLPIMILHII
jgi:hypothetical protein